MEKKIAHGCDDNDDIDEDYDDLDEDFDDDIDDDDIDDDDIDDDDIDDDEWIEEIRESSKKSRGLRAESLYISPEEKEKYSMMLRAIDFNNFLESSGISSSEVYHSILILFNIILTPSCSEYSIYKQNGAFSQIYF